MACKENKMIIPSVKKGKIRKINTTQNMFQNHANNNNNNNNNNNTEVIKIKKYTN